VTINRGRAKPRPAQTPPRFKVGDIVAVTGAAGVLLPKHEERALLEARFEVTRQLPDREQRFHYRIRNTLTGQERAISEAGLREASSHSSSAVERNDGSNDAAFDSTGGLGIAGSNASPAGWDDPRAEITDVMSPLDENKLSLPKPARAAPGRAR
jgi:hypothetical protein